MPGQDPGIESPEIQLLLACARARPDEGNVRRIQALLDTPVDWNRVLRAARRHRVTLLLDRSLKAATNGKPNYPHQELLREHARAYAARNTFLARELIRLIERFQSEQIPVIPYKGPVVASLAYGDLGLREFNDLDFLIRPEHVTRINTVLRDEGFETADRYTPRELAHVHREFKEHCFQSGLVVVEPHWSITARRFPFPIDYDALWTRTAEARFCDTRLRVFSPEDWLVILCVTGAKSQWRRLELVCDVAESLRAFPEIDWAAVERTSTTTGSQRMVRLGLALATKLLDAHIPEELARQIEADTQVRRLKQTVIGSLFLDHEPVASQGRSARRFSPLLMAMRERPSDRWSYLWRTLTTPTVDHIRRYPLPETLWPLYSLIVPLNDYVARPLVQAFRSLRVGQASPGKTS